MYYILDDDGEPVKVEDGPDGLTEWAQWWEASNDLRRLAWTDLEGGVSVSTVFLASDHRYRLRYPHPNPNPNPNNEPLPLLWETMVFGGEHDQYQERYTSRESALEGHARVVHLLQEKKSPYGDEGNDEREDDDG